MKSADSILELDMATTLVNCFGLNRMPNIREDRSIGPGTFIHMARFQKKYELFDFGLGSISVYSE